MNKKSVAVIAFLAFVIITSTVFYIYKSNKEAATKAAEEFSEDVVVPPITERDHVVGEDSAIVTVFEYSELECPYCKEYHSKRNLLFKEFGKKIKTVFRNFPLASHPKSEREAIAAECAYEQGGHEMFWKYIDRIFEITPSNNKLPEHKLYETARELGLNEPSFIDCVREEKTKNKVDGDRVGGALAGVHTVPAFIFSKAGHKKVLIQGGSYEQVRIILKTLLREENRR